MPKQEFEVMDYTGPLVVGFLFCVALFLISFFVINFLCITKYDDITKFELFAGRYNVRLGPHSLKAVNRGGYVSEDDEEPIEVE